MHQMFMHQTFLRILATTAARAIASLGRASCLAACLVGFAPSGAIADVEARLQTCAGGGAKTTLLDERIAACDWALANKSNLGENKRLLPNGQAAVLLARAKLYEQQGDQTRELADIEAALAMKVDDRSVFKSQGSRLVQRMRRLMDTDPARALRILLAMRQEDVDEFIEIPRAEAYGVSGDYKAAFAEIDKWGTKRNGLSETHYLKRIGIMARAGQFGQALADMKTYREKFAKAGDHGASCLESWLLYLKGDVDGAATLAGSILEPKAGEAVSSFSISMIGLVEAISSGIAGNCRDALPLAKLERNDWKGAFDTFEVVGFDPRSAEEQDKSKLRIIATYAYARALELKGDKAEAKRFYKIAAGNEDWRWDAKLYRTKAAERIAALDKEGPLDKTPAKVAAASGPGKRVALVIGNARYKNVPVLPNAGNDAKAVAAALRRLGFADVTEAYDLGIDELSGVVKKFGDQAADSDWAVIYYSGHGLELSGSNYIIPVDAKLAHANHVADEALPLDRLISKASGARKLKLVILDACRDNPFQRTMQVPEAKRSLTRGLARVEPKSGVLVAFAAREGQVALDGDGANSPYAGALLDELESPALEIGDLFRRVRDNVLKKTANRQEPFTYGSLPSDALYFKPPGK